MWTWTRRICFLSLGVAGMVALVASLNSHNGWCLIGGLVAMMAGGMFACHTLAELTSQPKAPEGVKAFMNHHPD